MKRLVVLGAGTAGTMVVNKLRRALPEDEWAITVVDHDQVHRYQPGYLFLPFGGYQPSQITKPMTELLTPGIEKITAEIERVDIESDEVVLGDGKRLRYDQLVIATGTHPRPDQTPGMDGAEWRNSVFDFYTLDGAEALGEKLRAWDGGRLVVHITEMPIKCPVAPLEFTFLADSYFKDRAMRDRVEIVYVTPLDGAFTKPVASKMLGGMLEDRKIQVETDFYIQEVDNERRCIVSYDEREIPFDLLVTVPLNMGADYVARSGIGNELNYVPVDPGTFLSKASDNVFAIGDAADLPTSKAGSVAHFAVEVFVENFLHHIRGEQMPQRFDGHANCFVESGDGKALLIDFNYDVQPLPGKYPLPVVGPFSLLQETEVNHFGKLAFKWIYWHALLPGRELPLPALMSMLGKEEVEA
ncbi:MAG TPA: FAD/NAD(P)-binding oxidoreductase [Acidimicrobiia bacterium]|nr:FAD/NAD(P)-binding oxidoreductase [Acidimicrobiia bacterium]